MIGQKRYKAVSSIKSTILASHSHERIQLIGQRISVVQTKLGRSTGQPVGVKCPTRTRETPLTRNTPVGLNAGMDPRVRVTLRESTTTPAGTHDIDVA